MEVNGIGKRGSMEKRIEHWKWSENVGGARMSERRRLRWRASAKHRSPFAEQDQSLLQEEDEEDEEE